MCVALRWVWHPQYHSGVNEDHKPLIVKNPSFYVLTLNVFPSTEVSIKWFVSIQVTNQPCPFLSFPFLLFSVQLRCIRKIYSFKTHGLKKLKIFRLGRVVFSCSLSSVLICQKRRYFSQEHFFLLEMMWHLGNKDNIFLQLYHAFHPNDSLAFHPMYTA